MRYPASEKLEIIRLVERSHLSARRTLANLGIAKTTFYRAPLKLPFWAKVGQHRPTLQPFNQYFGVPTLSRGNLPHKSKLQAGSSCKFHGEPAMARRSN